MAGQAINTGDSQAGFRPASLDALNFLLADVRGAPGPAVSALTLGLVPRAALARRLGRNAAFDHAGNVAIAAAAGAVGYFFSQRAVFLMAPLPRSSSPT